MLDRYIKLTRALRLRPRARFSEKPCWLSRRREEMTFLTCEPRVSSRSHGQAVTCIDLMFSSNIDATLGVFDESDVLAWPKVSVPPVSYSCIGV